LGWIQLQARRKSKMGAPGKKVTKTTKGKGKIQTTAIKKEKLICVKKKVAGGEGKEGYRKGPVRKKKGLREVKGNQTGRRVHRTVERQTPKNEARGQNDTLESEEAVGKG